LGVPIPKEGAGGNAIGAIWAPSSQDPKNQTRSYSVTAHYKRVIKKRPNYHILTNHVVEKVTFSDNLVASGVVFRAKDGTTASVKAKLEVVIAAGSVHTPGVLQRSGVGPKEILQKAGIKVLLDLPGVGKNFQDHPTAGLNFACKFANSFSPDRLSETP
jgi:choline dehydrogenase-like flavoprotein